MPSFEHIPLPETPDLTPEEAFEEGKAYVPETAKDREDFMEILRELPSNAARSEYIQALRENGWLGEAEERKAI